MDSFVSWNGISCFAARLTETFILVSHIRYEVWCFP